MTPKQSRDHVICINLWNDESVGTPRYKNQVYSLVEETFAKMRASFRFCRYSGARIHSESVNFSDFSASACAAYWEPISLGGAAGLVVLVPLLAQALRPNHQEKSLEFSSMQFQASSDWCLPVTRDHHYHSQLNLLLPRWFRSGRWIAH